MTKIYPIRYRSVCNCEHSDRLAVSTFLSQIENEQSSATQSTLLAQSNLVGGMHNDKLIGLVAYNLNNDKGRKENRVMAIRTVTLAKKYQTTRILYTGLKQVMAQCAETGVQRIELWAPEQSRWLNKCYATLATPIGTQLDRDEQCCVVYQTDVERIQTVLKQQNIQSVAYLPGYDSMMVAMVQAI